MHYTRVLFISSTFKRINKLTGLKSQIQVFPGGIRYETFPPERGVRVRILLRGASRVGGPRDWAQDAEIFIFYTTAAERRWCRKCLITFGLERRSWESLPCKTNASRDHRIRFWHWQTCPYVCSQWDWLFFRLSPAYIQRPVESHPNAASGRTGADQLRRSVTRVAGISARTFTVVFDRQIDDRTCANNDADEEASQLLFSVDFPPSSPPPTPFFFYFSKRYRISTFPLDVYVFCVYICRN